jgi:hypothetical protein
MIKVQAPINHIFHPICNFRVKKIPRITGNAIIRNQLRNLVNDPISMEKIILDINNCCFALVYGVNRYVLVLELVK